MFKTNKYRHVYNIRRIKSKNWNVSCLVLQLRLLDPLKPGVKSTMKTKDAPATSEWSAMALPTKIPLILKVWRYIYIYIYIYYIYIREFLRLYITIVYNVANIQQTSSWKVSISKTVWTWLNCHSTLFLNTYQSKYLDSTVVWTPTKFQNNRKRIYRDFTRSSFTTS